MWVMPAVLCAVCAVLCSCVLCVLCYVAVCALTCAMCKDLRTWGGAATGVGRSWRRRRMACRLLQSGAARCTSASLQTGFCIICTFVAPSCTVDLAVVILQRELYSCCTLVVVLLLQRGLCSKLYSRVQSSLHPHNKVSNSIFQIVNSIFHISNSICWIVNSIY